METKPKTVLSEEEKERIMHTLWVKSMLYEVSPRGKASARVQRVLSWFFVAATIIGGLWLCAFLLKGLLTILGLIR